MSEQKYKEYTISLLMQDGRKYKIPIAVPYGPKGDKGDRGEKGNKGDKGDKGDRGADGTVAFADLTDEQKASLKGEKGDTGAQGLQGPQGDKGDRGADGANGYTPQKGIDYFTDADKTEMVEAVIAALPKYSGEVTSV